MKCEPHTTTTGFLPAPKGWDHGKVPMEPIPISERNVDGYLGLVSFWRPTADEVAEILSGAAIQLTIFGEVHPAVQLKVAPR